MDVLCEISKIFRELHITTSNSPEAVARKCSVKKGFLKKSQKFSREHLCPNFLFNEFAGWNPTTLLKERCHHGCFLVNFANILRIFSLQIICETLLAFAREVILDSFINPFSTNVPFTVKTGSWFLPAKCLKNTCERVTF